MKCIGVVGGLSPESTVTYYQKILRRHREVTGDQVYPRLLVASVPFGRYVAWQHEGDWDAIAKGVRGELDALAAAGADFALLATNTLHKILPRIEAPLPVLDVLEVVASAARARGIGRVGLTGTRFTMEDGFYADRLRARGVEVVVPPADARAAVHRIIYDDLAVGRVEDSARRAFDAIAEGLVARGADAVLLGCTELELLARGRDVGYATLDSADLHATRAWEVAAGRAPLVWIAPGRPDTPEALRLLEASDAYAGALYPAESNHLLPVDALLAPDVRFFHARVDGRVVGCGAVVLADGWAEVKRMFTDPAARGLGAGRAMLARLEDEARAAGCAHLRLETGVRNDEALALYRTAGFATIGPFADYRPDPLSVFLEKPLA